MIEWLEQIDQQLLVAINGWRSPFWSEVMWTISNKFVWFPLYILLFVLVYVKYSIRAAILFTLFGFAAVGLADFTATYIFKEGVARYRPSHHETLQHLLFFYEMKPGELYKGGQYGFVSGHATNSFVIAVMFSLRLRASFSWIAPILLIWACTVAYSRIYLGVHYPSDIFGGALLGTLIAILIYKLYQLLLSRMSR